MLHAVKVHAKLHQFYVHTVTKETIKLTAESVLASELLAQTFHDTPKTMAVLTTRNLCLF